MKIVVFCEKRRLLLLMDSRIYLFSETVHTGSGVTQLLVQRVPVFFSTVEGPERKVDHLSPCDAEVSNCWGHSYIPLTFLTLCTLLLGVTPVPGHKCIIETMMTMMMMPVMIVIIYLLCHKTEFQ